MNFIILLTRNSRHHLSLRFLSSNLPPWIYECYKCAYYVLFEYIHITHTLYIHTHTHIFVYICMNIYIYVYIFVCIYIYVYIFVYIYIYLFIYIYMNKYSWSLNNTGVRVTDPMQSKFVLNFWLQNLNYEQPTVDQKPFW